MRLIYNSVYDIGDFETCELKEGYFKTYYAVIELIKDHYSTRYCGLMSQENEWYNKGYYVVPCYFDVKKWMCGDKIILYKRRFCDMFGRAWPHEPKDVDKKNWWKCAEFKKYWGMIPENSHIGYIEQFELYDDADEAINRAKELDILMKLNEKYDDIYNRLELRRKEKDKLKYFLKRYPPHTERQKLEYQIKEMTYKNKLKTVDKLHNDIKKLENKIKLYTKYNT